MLRMRSTVRRRLGNVYHTDATVRELDGFDFRHDRLWESVSSSYGCAAVRNASYLNWKYVAQPNQSFVRLEVSLHDRVIACIVLSIRESEKAYQYRRVNIIDIVASTDPVELNTALVAIVSYAKSRGIDAIFMHVINSQIQQTLDNFGFIKREPTRYLMVALDAEAESSLLLDPAQWLITQGDSDIDRPF